MKNNTALVAFALATVGMSVMPLTRPVNAQGYVDSANDLRATSITPPDPSKHGDGVHVTIINGGRTNVTNFKVTLHVWEYEDGRIGKELKYTKTVALLKPNYTTKVTVSGFKWPNGSQYDGYVQIGNKSYNVRF